LRAFAALAVFIFHLDAWQVAALPLKLSSLGSSGVAFFFVLSGFVLAWGTDPRLPVKTFYRRRFARVYPLDLVTLVIASLVPVVAVDRSWEAAVANAFMLQAWFRDYKIVYGMNGVSWSLSCEAFFYAVSRSLPSWCDASPDPPAGRSPAWLLRLPRQRTWKSPILRITCRQSGWRSSSSVSLPDEPFATDGVHRSTARQCWP
jgi:hypothetical protein